MFEDKVIPQLTRFNDDLGVQAGALTPAFAAAIVAGGVLTILPATLGGDLLARHLGGEASMANGPIPTVEART